MSLTCAYERRNVAPQLALPASPQRAPRRAPAAIAAPPTVVATSEATTASSSALPRPFKRLTPAEMADRRKLGLCYNCDEPYIRGHKCPHLFYLEVSDYIMEEPKDDAPADPAATDVANAVAFDPETPMISLSAITGIRTEDTMQLRI